MTVILKMIVCNTVLLTFSRRWYSTSQQFFANSFAIQLGRQVICGIALKKANEKKQMLKTPFQEHLFHLKLAELQDFNRIFLTYPFSIGMKNMTLQQKHWH